MDLIQKTLIKAGRKDLAQEYYQKIAMDDKPRRVIENQLDIFWKKGWTKFWDELDDLKKVLENYRSVTRLEDIKMDFENFDRHLSTVNGYLTKLVNDISDTTKNIQMAEKNQKKKGE